MSAADDARHGSGDYADEYDTRLPRLVLHGCQGLVQSCLVLLSLLFPCAGKASLMALPATSGGCRARRCAW